MTDTDAIADTVYRLHRGSAPLLLSLPHVGTALPDWLSPRLNDRALAVEDTDWHLERVFDFARALGASLLVPRHSRYVVDLNRPPETAPMYPGANNTGLCPLTFFDGQPLYRDGQAPAAAEVAERVTRYWRPYHQALAAELARLHQRHGRVVLFDGHSIKSELPWLFEGQLPALNLGTVDGSSCAGALRQALSQLLAGQTRYNQVIDGRFKGGYITRQYGAPDQGIHAVQLEMCWRCYMDEAPPYAWHAGRAAEVQPLLGQMVQAMLDFARTPQP